MDEYHGTQGPVQATFPDGMYGGPQQGAFIDTITNLSGIPHLADINGGDALGVAYTPQVCPQPSYPRTLADQLSTR